MKTRLLGVLAWLLLTEVAIAQSQYQSYVHSVLQDVSQELMSCGLNIVQWQPTNPNDNRRSVIVATDGRYLAWYLEGGTGWTAQHEFRDYWTGGYVHSITYDNQRLRFKVPTPGIVASITMQRYGVQWVYAMRCRAYQVGTKAEFEQCVRDQFIAPIVQQLCNA